MRLLPLLTLLAVGCGAYEADKKADYADAPSSKMEQMGRATAGGEDAGEASGQPLPDSAAIERKIIYTADVNLVVEEFGDVPSRVQKLVKQFDGYVANSKIVGSPGRPRSGQWKVRVPVARYEEFLDAAQNLGELRSISRDSQDVSEEYYDVQARIRNKKKTVERLVALKDTTGELKDLLEVDRELDRVQEEIDRLEGRMRVLNELTSLTTVNLSIDEIKDYVPEEAVGYTTRLRRAVSTSLSRLWAAAQDVSIGLIAALPWIIVFAVPLVLLWLIWRGRRRRRG